MSLQQWLDNGWLIRHTTTPQEIQSLFDLADRDLADAQAAPLSDDWRFSIAYNAALQMATAALYASGYQPPRGQSHHLRAIQSLQYTVGAGQTMVRALDGFRGKRHAGVYDRAGAVSPADAAEMLALAKTVRQLVEQWLTVHHPNLLPGP